MRRSAIRIRVAAAAAGVALLPACVPNPSDPLAGLTPAPVVAADTASTVGQATPAGDSGQKAYAVRGAIAGPGSFELFELGPAAAGEEWTVSDANQSASTLFTVALFDDNLDLLRREVITRGAPLRHRLRADSSLLYVGVTTAYANSGGSFSLTATATGPATPPGPATQRVYLNFAGSAGVNIHSRAAIRFGPFNAAALGAEYAGKTADMKTAIVNTVREDYAPYNVEVYTSDDGPPVGPFSTVHFGGNDNALLGLADDVDQYNDNPSQSAIVYVENFADFAVMELTADEFGQMIGNVASHELGHLLGLYHTKDPVDIMDTTGSAWDLAGAQAHSRAALEDSVFPVGASNAPRLLELIVGLNPNYTPPARPEPRKTDIAKVRRREALMKVVSGELRNRCGICCELDPP